MRFSTGLFDALFGEKTTLEVRQDDGSLRKVRVTTKWLAKMEAQGKLSATSVPENVVHVHIVSPHGLRQTEFVVGEDIPEAQYRKLVDPETDALYAVEVYKNGEPEITVVPRAHWNQVRKAMDSA